MRKFHPIAWLTAFLPAALFTVAAEAEPFEEPLTLWYRQPAGNWNEALPLGNGRLGAMVFGGVEKDRLQLNEDTLLSGVPHDYAVPGAAQYLPEVRRLLFAGKESEATRLADRHMMGKPLFQQGYQPLGDLMLAFPDHATATEYRRELAVLAVARDVVVQQ